METSPLSGVGLGDGSTIGCSVDGTVLTVEHGFGRHLFCAVNGVSQRGMDGQSHGG